MERLFGFCVLLFAASCAETSQPEPPAPAPDETEASATLRQPVLDDGPNWFVAGGDGLVELVGGTDGEPDELTGRFALGGEQILGAESGTDKWVVVGNGKTQPLDDSGLRLRESRDALASQPIHFIESAPTGWLIGGGEGRLQLLDNEGEPTATMIQVLGQTMLNGAAFNGNSWLVVGENGNIVVVNQDLGLPTSPSGQTADGGEPIVATVADPSGAGSPPFIAFSADSSIDVSGTGVPGTVSLIESGLQITAAEYGDGKIYIGTSDGRVGVANYGSSPSFTFTDVVGGGAVNRLVSNGTDWIALGDNGQAQRFDADGNTLGAAVEISSAGRGLVGAHWASDRWLIIVGEIGFVAFVDEQLAAPRELSQFLSGGQVLGASAGAPGVLVTGSDGWVQLLDERGASVTQPAQVSGAGDLHAAAWNGDAWLVGGAGGFSQLVDAAGSPTGSPTTLLDGSTVRFAAWSGEFWLVGGDGGKFQLVRADGTSGGNVRTLEGAQTLYDARWNGREWLMAGESTTGAGIFGLTVVDQNVEPTPAEVAEAGAFRAVDFNGIEWLVAGDDGLIQRVSAQGMPVDVPMDVLTGFTIHDVYYNGVNYIVVGEFGAVRRLGQDYLPLRAPIAVLDRQTARVVEWTNPRGFPTGPCLTNDVCYEAVCVGGLGPGKCCDSACDKPCESCFEDHTGQPDGTCAPVVEGKTPPAKPNSPADACTRQSESTCGFTGVCDGAGECQFYGAEVECGEAVCSLNEFTPVAVCNGAGSCGATEEIACSPYAGCSPETGCLESCNADVDCVDGFRCQDGECVEDGGETGMEMEDGEEDPPDSGDDGCCATVNSSPDSTSWVALLLLGCVAWRRRR